MNPYVVVIGGGIVGILCAYYLAQIGEKAHLVEKGLIGFGASRVGMIHVVTWEEPEIHLELARQSNLLFEELSQTLPIHIEYRHTGSLKIVEIPKKIDSMQKTVERLQTWGLNCRMLSSQDLLELEPNIAPDVAGGVFFDEDSQVILLYITHTLAQAAQQMGTVLESIAEVTGFEFSGDKNAVTDVITKRGRIPTNLIVIAMGAWFGLVGDLIGFDIPIIPRKGTLFIIVPVSPDIIRTKVILVAGSTNGIEVAANILHLQNGNLLLGSSQQFVGFDTNGPPEVIVAMVKRNLRFFLILSGVMAIRTWAGCRPYTPDLLPIISPVEEIDGMFLACRHEGIGITEGPITGKLIYQLVTGQKPGVS